MASLQPDSPSIAAGDLARKTSAGISDRMSSASGLTSVTVPDDGGAARALHPRLGGSGGAALGAQPVVGQPVKVGAYRAARGGCAVSRPVAGTAAQVTPGTAVRTAGTFLLVVP